MITRTQEGWWVLEKDTHLSRWIEQHGRLDVEQRTIEFLQPYLEGRTAFDLGASLGDHTVAYARHAKRVIAFEPIPESFRCLQLNCANLSNVICLNIAIGASTGRAEICRSDNVGASRLGADREAPHDSTAPVYTLDGICEVMGIWPEFIKADIEGWEEEMVIGGEKAVTSSEYVFTEVNRGCLEARGFTPESLRERMRELGFSPHHWPDALPQFDVLWSRQ